MTGRKLISTPAGSGSDTTVGLLRRDDAVAALAVVGGVVVVDDGLADVLLEGGRGYVGRVLGVPAVVLAAAAAGRRINKGEGGELR